MYPEVKKSSRTTQVLNIMHVLSWIAFVGLSIKAGALITSFIVSWFNPELSENMYMKLGLENLRQYGIEHYIGVASLMVVIACLKAHVLYLVIRALSKVNMANPFTKEVSRILESISYALLGIWVIILVHNAYTGWLSERAGLSLEQWSAEEFIFISGLVFIISQIFKRGMELQSENDLTV